LTLQHYCFAVGELVVESDGILPTCSCQSRPSRETAVAPNVVAICDLNGRRGEESIYSAVFKMSDPKHCLPGLRCAPTRNTPCLMLKDHRHGANQPTIALLPHEIGLINPALILHAGAEASLVNAGSCPCPCPCRPRRPCVLQPNLPTSYMSCYGFLISR
jgi:hypothetical protein